MPYPFVLRPLPFHHDKHVQAYVDNLNKALADCTACQRMTLEELLQNLDTLPADKCIPVRNNAGGVYNHYLYFDCMAPNAGGRPSGRLAQAMDTAFGSFEDWKQRMKAAAVGQFGSGYAWLVCDRSRCISVVQSANQDCPLSKGQYPLLCVDVWEHAYYLDYQNRRADYVDAWFNLINWPYVQGRYDNCPH